MPLIILRQKLPYPGGYQQGRISCEPLCHMAKAHQRGLVHESSKLGFGKATKDVSFF